MRSNPHLQTGSTSRAALMAGLCVALAACDPALLSPELRQAVTGTTDVGRLTLEVTPPETTLDEQQTAEFSYRVTSGAVGEAAFNGTISLSLSSLPPEVELVENVRPESFPLQGSGVVEGTFKLRGVGPRDAPFEVQLTMTSVGASGSRVVHPPAIVRLLSVRPRLRVACQRDPDSGLAPLRVGFTAQTLGCSGPCRWSWDFGDGSSTAARNPAHVYVAPGKYTATVTLSDDRSSVQCSRSVVVSTLEDPSPPPPPPANQPPSIQNLVVAITGVPNRRITATVADPDGDAVTWTIEVISGAPGATLTPAAGAGPALSSAFVAGGSFPYTLRIRALDDRGGQAVLTFVIPSIPTVRTVAP